MALIAASPKVLKDYYGEVSGILRSDNFPQSEQCYIVQHQNLTAYGLSPWITDAVYCRYEEAEMAVARWDTSSSTHGVLNAETNECNESDEQMIITWRIITLLDLVFESGPSPLANAVMTLMMSDHEWHLSTEVGSAEKIALHTAFLLAASNEQQPDPRPVHLD